MKTKLATRLAALSLAAALAVGQTGCGIIFHPERSGNRPGKLDVTAVVLDCCWLLVGVVPGVVALAVDFGTGGAWHSSGPLGHAPGESDERHVMLRVLDASGRDLVPPVRVPGSEFTRRVNPEGV